MLLEHVRCDLCGGAGYRVRYRKPDNWLRGTMFEFPVVECDGCGLIFVNPRPTPAAMATFYPPGYHDGRDDEPAQARYAVQRSMIPPVASRRVLDIGCARGDFLRHLLDHDDGVEAHGIDAYSTGVGDPRIAFRQGDFATAGYPASSFDLVTAWAVFEHLHAPLAYFREASNVLRPGGSLVILVTNADSFYGRAGYLEDVPRHTYHFTASTLAAYGERTGLVLKSLVYDDRVFDGRGRGTLRFLLGRLAGFSWERYMRDEIGPLSRLAMRVGGALDAVLFATHWEARFRRSGIMIATYEKA